MDPYNDCDFRRANEPRADDVHVPTGKTRLELAREALSAAEVSLAMADDKLANAQRARDLAVGNVVGSNILNLLLVLGLTAIVASGGVPVSRPAINLDLPVMVAVAVACLPIFFTGHCIKRWEGVVFLGYYVAYTVYLLLGAQGHDALEDFRIAMTWFVIPLTVLTLAVSLGRALQSRRRAAPKPLR